MQITVLQGEPLLKFCHPEGTRPVGESKDLESLSVRLAPGEVA